MYIKIGMPNLDMTSHLSSVVEKSIRDSMKHIGDNLQSKSHKSALSTSFSKFGTEFVGTIELDNGWDKHKQGNQLSIQTPSRQPVSSVNKTPNQIPQWGRMPSTRSASPVKVTRDKSNDPRNIYFKNSSVPKNSSAIQDTFLQVFGNNAKYLVEQKGGL